MKRELARLIGAQVCVHMGMAGTRMAAPLLALREGHSAASVGVLLALFALSQVFLSLPAGRFADRHGLRRPVAYAATAAMLGAGAAALWPTFWVLCFAALLTGAATGSTIIAVQRQAGFLATGPTELKQVFGWLAIGPALSNFAGPFAAGLLIDLAGFRAAFAMLALVPLAGWWGVRSLPVRKGLQAPPGPEGRRRSSWDLMRAPAFRRIMLINWVVSSCWDVHTFLVPVLGHERGLSASAIGTVLGGFALAATGVRMLLPLAAKHVSEARVVVTAMACATVLFALYPLAHAAWSMSLLSVLLGFALGAVQPMVMSAMHQVTPAHRHGEAIGLRMMAVNGSSVLMPLLFGSAGAVLGASGVFWIMGALAGVTAPVARRLGQGRIEH